MMKTLKVALLTIFLLAVWRSLDSFQVKTISNRIWAVAYKFHIGHIHAFYLLVQHAGKSQPYQQVPTARTHVPHNEQHRQYDVYQPKQVEVTQQGNNALVKDYKNQEQYAEGSYNNSASQQQPQSHYKATDGNAPPPYKS